MKKLLLGMICIVLVYTSASAKEGNNSRIQNLEAQVAELQNLINEQNVATASASEESEVVFELCNLFVLTDNTPPTFCRDCGNSDLELLEQCDDGNAVSGDGCSTDCFLEICGNGIIDPNEECDDGNVNEGDMCSSLCTKVSKTVFVTSQKYTGDLGGLVGADAICNQLASEAGLPGEYIAWLSDSETSASERVPHDAGNYVLVDGSPVAVNWEDLTKGFLGIIDTNVRYKINQDEKFTLTEDYVWTNTKFDGQTRSNNPINNCNNWTSSDSSWPLSDGTLVQLSGGLGNSGYFDKNWTDRNAASKCYYARRLYCFEK